MAVATIATGQDQPNVEVLIRGAELSRLGAVEIQMRPVVQKCRQACDDFMMRTYAPEGGYDITVRDGARRTLAKGGSGYVTSGIKTQIVVSATDKITFEESIGR